MFRIIALLLAICTFASTELPPQFSVDASVAAKQIVSPTTTLDRDQRELVDFALERFERAGLELPSDLRITFPADKARCFDYGGVYVPSKVEVRICRPSDTTIVHELAHAWIESTFSDRERMAFMELRGLDTWTGGAKWDERGAEQAAEVLTWALMDRDITFRWLEHGPNNTFVETFRLLKIDKSKHEDLVEAYRLLTGTDPVYRNARPSTAPNVPSPEARRVGIGHAGEVGGLRHNGVIVSPEAVQRAFSSAVKS